MQIKVNQNENSNETQAVKVVKKDNGEVNAEVFGRLILVKDEPMEVLMSEIEQAVMQTLSHSKDNDKAYLLTMKSTDYSTTFFAANPKRKDVNKVIRITISYEDMQD